MEDKQLFIYGFGNPGRQDDGMGPAIIDRLELENIQGLALDSNYQMNIEDAYNISQCNTVIFVDASIDAEEPFSFYKIKPASEITFTTHTMAPESVIALCKDLYDKDMEAYVMAIKGYEWEFTEGLTTGAADNFNKAYSFLLNKIEDLLKEHKILSHCCAAENTN